jgi:hypothetical protein
MVKQAEKYGARVALFGRKIFFAEDCEEIVRHMRLVIEEDVSSEEATKRYHDVLQKKGIRSRKALADDLEITDPSLQMGA